MIHKINFSGHQNQALDDAGFRFPGIIQVVPGEDATAVAHKLNKFIKKLGIGSGDTVQYTAPGMSLLATLIPVILHGLTGQFPILQTLIRQPDGTFVLDSQIDLQLFRNVVCRTERQQLINL